MLETPHVIVAAAIAVNVANPALAIPLALGSHFVLEKIPHWNPHLNTELKKYGKITSQSTNIVIADSALALSLGGLTAYIMLPDVGLALTVLLACFVAVMPDLIEAPYYFLRKKSDFIVKKWIPFKKSVQIDASKGFGLLTQLLVVLASIWWILT
ncbi:hypothetical protein A2865_00625 [Candidatus Woesebacteria bacterium RIFCSPHIGHO2_01_FULL_39_17]|uniref:Uncharacterized protein n=3 Tax=Candidatus Woeseibacteriota TaxID=1752722 RepID=A0A0G0RIL4_9BACT|nr:MAG: hypothetical protein US72_C0013G0027 [Microgenomates group bacterium GW2011_GWC1_38_12]KKQ93421.1 MAG: hypothetical protein UT19_C0012G0010 [Candidatus Woesebacteria bacterium GW2011_GWB1_39_10b]KKR13487.1 MAG: hypothetical protein UT40_C0016G0018 [Candidatus Woesebacteria bacterium GW2011_GWA1_39_21b]OGM22907.1 MAG: hypothetical protein A2865_00625 [Candidatus Woesebacteria bacterium RIFCSPHIGHO2_01_FULL_39_17]OGM61333.1 MAG: hypothetical protein A3A52_03485 [Candidatus Woesebacteria b